MKKYTNQQLLKDTEVTGVVPVFYAANREVALAVVKACFSAGLRAFEFTNRGPEALEVFEYLVKNRSEYPQLALGIGTIMNADQARDFTEVGADFIVSPILDKETSSYCQSVDIPWIPGCATLTEIITGVNWGASLVKAFPGNTLGPGFVQGILGPCPQLKIMPTGGVEPTSENLSAWFKAGVHCVGMGSQLMDKKMIQDQAYDNLSKKIKDAVALVSEIRS